MVGRFPIHSEAKLSSQLYQDLVNRGVVLLGLEWPCVRSLCLWRATQDLLSGICTWWGGDAVRVCEG